MASSIVEIAVNRLHRRYGMEVELSAPKIPYRETIRGSARRKVGIRSRRADMASSATARSEWSRFRAAQAFNLLTTYSVDLFQGSIFRLSRKASSKRHKEEFLAGYPVVDFKVTLL